MGREAYKAADNPWYRARKRAADWNEHLSSRAGAAELLNVSEDVVISTETDKYKQMPVETAVRMADLYNAPELLNCYCKNNCLIGRNKPISDEIVDIDRVTVRVFKKMRLDVLEEYKNQLLDIAEDGEVSEEELPNLIEINEYLKELSKTLSEIETLTERTIKKNSRK